MRKRYVVTYDVRNDTRLRKVYALMRGFGEHIQYSVFRCDLSDSEKITMISELADLINHAEDQVLIIDIGPPDGRGKSCIETLGVSLPPSLDSVVVI